MSDQDAAARAKALSRLQAILEGVRTSGELAKVEANRNAVYERYGPVFTPSAIPALSKYDFSSFLNFKNNKHWSGLQRLKGKLTRDMGALRAAFLQLLDESTPLEERFRAALSSVKGLGPAVATPVMHLAEPRKYAVMNALLVSKLKGLGLYPKVGDRHQARAYPTVNELCLGLARDLGVDMWVLDWLWNHVGHRHDPEAPQYAPGITPTYLLTWNPARWPWKAEARASILKDAQAGRLATETWSTGNSKQPKPGDRFYMLRQGEEYRGIFASGRFLSEVTEREHWDPERRAAGELHNGADIVFDEFIDPEGEYNFLYVEDLEEKFPSQGWTPQSSGVRVDDKILTELEWEWQWILREAESGPISLARSLDDMRASMATFARALELGHVSAQFANWHPTYMVHDEATGMIAPAKWAALAGMTPEVYVALQTLSRNKEPRPGFDGARTRKGVEQLTGQTFQADAELASRLRERLESAYGPGLLKNRAEGSWKFVTLPTKRNYWWVNQGKTWAEEREGGFIWAPQRGKRDIQFKHWTNVSLVKAGDIICSYANGSIRAISHAVSDGVASKRPTALDGGAWGAEGWRADLSYNDLEQPVPLQSVSDQIVKLGLDHGPLNYVGGVNQGYLYQLSDEAAHIVLKQAGLDVEIPTPERPYQEESGMTATRPQNVILYGPPGTGKTYHTVERAVLLCDGDSQPHREAYKQRFDELCERGRVGFVTFHQSYGYEEFVEGIRPVLQEEGEAVSGSDVKYEIRPGVFKRMCARARAGKQVRSQTDWSRASGGRAWKMSLGSPGSDEDHIYDECIENGYILLGYGAGIDFSAAQTAEDVDRLYREWANEHDKELTEQSYAIKAVNVLFHEMRVGDLVVVSDGNKRFRAVGEVTGEGRYLERDDELSYKQCRDVRWLAVFEESLSHDVIARRRFSQRTLYELKAGVLKDQELLELISEGEAGERPPHVLIIDEINRGNVSKILGELITLLEPDKREGEENEVIVELPYSGDRFGVPSNLHVLGTMNTADRSIAFLDSALRRRFEFEEMMPNLEVIREHVGEGGRMGHVDVATLLGTMNTRIEMLYDRDHAIGHSYFLGCKNLRDLRQAFVDRVIPLLQEYFYGDWARVAMVLGCPEGASGDAAPTHPMLTPTKLDASVVPGGSEIGLEDGTRWDVNPAFLDAPEEALGPFFQRLLSA